MSRASLTLATLLCATLLWACTAPQARGPEPLKPAAPRQKIVFDMGHGEIFGPDDTTDLGQSQAVARMQAAGFDVTVNPDTITGQDLEGVSGLIIAGPMRPLLREEYVAITDFVERGGTLLLTIHVPFPVLAVPAHWGLPVSPHVMESEQPLPGAGDPSVLIADSIRPGKLTEGVGRVLVVSGWPVEASGESASLAVSTGEGTWIDADRSGSREDSETASFGVVGIAGVGEGTVVVAGDDAIFANIAIGEADNARLLDNVLVLMSTALEV
jgi:hypothetical protein